MVSEQSSGHQDIALDIIRDPNQFSRHLYGEYKGVRQGLLDTLVVGRRTIYAQVAEIDRKKVLQEIEEVFEDRGYGLRGGDSIHLAVYKPFAFSRGFTEHTEWGNAIIRLDMLEEERVAEWGKYLTSVEFIQNRRLLVAEGISLIPFPVIQTKYRPENIALAADLEQAKRRVVLKLIPNIQDEEVQKALGFRYTADIIKSIVSPDWFP